MKGQCNCSAKSESISFGRIFSWIFFRLVEIMVANGIGGQFQVDGKSGFRRRTAAIQGRSQQCFIAVGISAAKVCQRNDWLLSLRFVRQASPGQTPLGLPDEPDQAVFVGGIGGDGSGVEKIRLMRSMLFHSPGRRNGRGFILVVPISRKKP